MNRPQLSAWHRSQAESIARAFPLETEQRAFLVCQKKGCEVIQRMEVSASDSCSVMEQFAHLADVDSGVYVTVSRLTQKDAL